MFRVGNHTRAELPSRAIGFSTSTCFPACNACHCNLFMKERWQAEIHGIDVGIPQDRCQVAVQLDRGEIETFARTSQISLRGRQIAGQLPLIVGKHRRQGRGRHLAECTQVNASHET